MGNQRGNAGKLVENAKNVGNQNGDAGNQKGNLSIAVQMTQNSNGKNNFQDGKKYNRKQHF